MDGSKWPTKASINFNKGIENNERELVKTIANVIIEKPVPLIDYSHYSPWRRLISVTFIVFLQISKMRKRGKTIVECVKSAQEYFMKISQASTFKNEIESMKKTNTCPSKSRLLPLNIFINENGILRARGRISNLSKRQYDDLVILDAKGNFTQLLIKHFHEKYFHGSNESVSNEFRQKYRIGGLQQALRSLVSKCCTCKWLRAHPSSPKMDDLPFARLAYRLMPFSHCDLDYFGPITIKIGRRREKRF